MKIVVQVRLMPTPEVASALECTLHACNDAANWLSGQAHERGETSRKALQGFAYRDLKGWGLSAQPALHVPLPPHRGVWTEEFHPSSQLGTTSKPGPSRPGQVDPLTPVSVTPSMKAV